MNKQIFILISVLVLLPLVISSQSDLGNVKQNTNVSLIQLCSNCSYNNITSIKYPDSSLCLSYQVQMTKDNTLYNYTTNCSDLVGTYIVTGFGDLDGVVTSWSYTYDVTTNGKTEPSGIVIVLFIIFFLILIGATCYLSLYSIGHLMSLDFDITDLAIDWGVYFMIIALYFLEEYYLGNLGIKEYLIWFLSIGGILLVLIPIIAIVVSIIVGSLNKKKANFGQPPKLWRRR